MIHDSNVLTDKFPPSVIEPAAMKVLTAVFVYDRQGVSTHYQPILNMGTVKSLLTFKMIKKSVTLQQTHHNVGSADDTSEQPASSQVSSLGSHLTPKAKSSQSDRTGRRPSYNMER